MAKKAATRAAPDPQGPPGDPQETMQVVDLPEPDEPAEEFAYGYRIARSITLYERCEPNPMRPWLTQTTWIAYCRVLDFTAPLALDETGVRQGSVIQMLNTWQGDDLGTVWYRRRMTGLERAQFTATWDPDTTGPHWRVETLAQEGVDGGAHHAEQLWDRDDWREYALKKQYESDADRYPENREDPAA